MKEFNTPICRAKRLDGYSYVEGYYCGGSSIVEKLPSGTNGKVKIDSTTLAIHIEGMFDKNGQKLFASLDMETKKGGDICLIKDNKGNIRESVLVWHKYALCIDTELINIIEDNDNFTGISPQQFKYYLEVRGIYE